MLSPENTVSPENRSLDRGAEIFQEREHAIHQRTDRMFAKLMPAQWLVGIAASLWVSPRSWAGSESQVHWHVWAAVVVGGGLLSLPLILTRRRPGEMITRQSIAFSQILTSALLVHLTGGRIETHFHIFGSLAFLAFYRDWKVLTFATGLVVLDHLVRGAWWPQSVFGVGQADSWRWLEHTGWVVFEDIFLFLSIRGSLQESRLIADRQAHREEVNRSIGDRVEQRTRELQEEVSDRKLAEARLESSLRSLAAINAVLDRAYLIAITDKAGKITHANDNFCRLSGYSRPELLGQNHRILKSGEHPDSFFREMWQVIRSGRVWRGEIRNRAKSGLTYWVDTAIGPMLDEEGNTKGYLAIRTDITERIRLNRELVESSRRAGMAEVATGVLHNVGNVLNSVNISCRMMRTQLQKSCVPGLQKVVSLLHEQGNGLPAFLSQGNQGDKLKDYLEQLAAHLDADRTSMLEEIQLLDKNIDHIKAIVARQQTYARISYAPEVVQAAELVNEALNMSARELALSEIEIIKDLDPLPPVSGDTHKILQILINFIRNARHACVASETPHRRLIVKGRELNGRVLVSVSDNGIGIPAENLTRVFSLGFTTRTGGHGFGLHAGANAAREMGARITAHSDGPGRGATFTLDLPITDAPPIEKDAPYENAA